jgi:DNA-binding PadR family transcriptional regulator
VLLTQPSEIHGWAVVTETSLAGGTVYPILQRLENIGWVTSRWDHTQTGRPPRRYYRVVEAHRREAAGLVAARMAAVHTAPHRKAARDA